MLAIISVLIGLLVVAVSKSTLAFDRGTKSRLYAEAGIEDYWVVNLVDRCLEGPEVLRSLAVPYRVKRTDMALNAYLPNKHKSRKVPDTLQYVPIRFSDNSGNLKVSLGFHLNIQWSPGD